MINFNRNNLDTATSPYLQQHKDNPIFWQEWSSEVRDYAQKNNKLLFISVGYATCQWCHVMCRESFSDATAAAFLNEQCVSVKVDREQRPDIDQFLMSYCITTQGSGGWPLNVILTPDLKPFAAFTYVPLHADNNLPGFVDILTKAVAFYHTNKDAITPYTPTPAQPQSVPEEKIIPLIQSYYDTHHGGFGTEPKFPPHTTLLFLLHYFATTHDQNVYGILKKTLEAMALGGLHDHLEGGFFRYCADAAWHIPHFEKMLYDQGLMVWTYSLAYKTLKLPLAKQVVEQLLHCLEISFEHDGAYYAGIDTNHTPQEEEYYLWTYQALQEALTPQELDECKRIYTIESTSQEPFLLLKRGEHTPTSWEHTLLELRQKRATPLVDTKIITSWNAMVGIGLIAAYRYVGIKDALQKAQQLYDTLWQKHVTAAAVYHSSLHTTVDQHGFLQDVASMLLFTTYLMEETGTYHNQMAHLQTLLGTFVHANVWYEITTSDFMPIPAAIGDQSMPSSTALALLAVVRSALLSNQPLQPLSYKEPLIFDFLNVSSLMCAQATIIEAPTTIEWKHLPAHCLQRRGATFKRYIGQTCTEYASEQELVNAMSAQQ